MVSEREYTYVLPEIDNSCKEHKTKCHSLIIIGANGSGKSHLGAWIEQNDVNRSTTLIIIWKLYKSKKL